jgi:hypothetical protein
MSDVHSYESEKRLSVESETLQEILEKYEFIFSDVLFNE